MCSIQWGCIAAEECHWLSHSDTCRHLARTDQAPPSDASASDDSVDIASADSSAVAYNSAYCVFASIFSDLGLSFILCGQV